MQSKSDKPNEARRTFRHPDELIAEAYEARVRRIKAKREYEALVAANQPPAEPVGVGAPSKGGTECMEEYRRRRKAGAKHVTARSLWLWWKGDHPTADLKLETVERLVTAERAEERATKR